MKVVNILLAIVTAGTGFLAAYKWYRASKVEIDLGYHLPGQPGGTVRRLGAEWPRFPESADPEIRQGDETAATWEAINESARLNKAAAIWTAVSVGFGALSALTGISL